MRHFTGTTYSFDQVAQQIQNNGFFVGHVRIEDCFADTEKNPRKSVNASGYALLEADILERGIRQNIECTIRHDLRKIEVNAGYTRYSIAKKHSFPSLFVSVYEQSEVDSTKSTGRENLLRSNLTPVEEGIYAETRLIELKNDVDELIVELGWSLDKLQSRLAITKVIPAVRDALVQQKIKIGHVQILVTLSEQSQAKVLDEILSRNMEVGETRQFIESKQIPLSIACFDTAGCTTCQHNTSRYGDLFETDAASLGSNCRNTKCFRDKTMEALDIIVTDKQQEFGTVRFDKDTTDKSHIKLVDVGPDGIGTDELSHCSDCQHYGCIVSTKKESAGEVTSPVCFDLSCHSQKREAYQKSLSASSANKNSRTEKVGSIHSNKKTKSTKPSITSQNSQVSKDTTETPIAFSSALRSHYVTTVASIVAERVKTSPSVKRAISVFALYREFKRQYHEKIRTHLSAVYPEDDLPELYSIDETKILSFLLNSPDSTVDLIEEELSSVFIKNLENNNSMENDKFFKFTIEVLRYLNVDVKEYWSVNESYIKLLTKASISKHLEDSGFKETFININGEAAYRTLMNSKVAELPNLIMNFKQFDWKNYLPQSMNLHAGI